MKLRKVIETKQHPISTVLAIIGEMLIILMKNRHNRSHRHRPSHSRKCSMILRRSINNLNSSNWFQDWLIDPGLPWLHHRMLMVMAMMLGMGWKIMRCLWARIIKIKPAHPNRHVIKIKEKLSMLEEYRIIEHPLRIANLNKLHYKVISQEH